MWCILIYRQAEVDVAMKDQLHQSLICCKLSAGALVALSLMDNQGRRKLLMGSYTGMVMICEPNPKQLKQKCSCWLNHPPFEETSGFPKYLSVYIT
jgi:hypothetical protein